MCRWPVVNGVGNLQSTKLVPTQPNIQKVKTMKYCAATTVGVMPAFGSILGPGATEAHVPEAPR